MEKKTSKLKNKTIIVGCGRLGAEIACKDSSHGKNVLVIDNDSSAFDKLSESFSGYTVQGDVTDLSVLEDAYIASAKEIVITTGDDNVNLFIAHVAREIYNVPNIYIRLDDPALEVLLRGMNIDIISPFELSIDKFSLMRGGKK